MVRLVGLRPHRQHSVAPNIVAMAMVAFEAVADRQVGQAVELQYSTLSLDSEIERVAANNKKGRKKNKSQKNDRTVIAILS